MNVHQASNFNVNYETIELKKIFGNQGLINKIGCVFVSKNRKSSSVREDFISISPLHGRACIKYFEDNYYSLKGTGWTFGGPSYFMSPTHEELFYGLLPEDYAKKELLISDVLNEKGFLAGRVIGYGLLGGLFSSLEVDNKPFNPSILYTQMVSPYRIADLIYFNLEKRRKLFQETYIASNPHLKIIKNSLNDLFWDFAKKLSIANNRLISMGGVNDSLMWDNITLACEIVDFENIYLPEINSKHTLNHLRLDDRQKQSYIWLFELLFKMVHVLELDITFQEIAQESFSHTENALLPKNKKFLESFIFSKN
jgi:hypothetical protein